MRSLPSSSASSSASCSYSLASTSLNNRLETVFKKASQLCTLCEIEACVIYYGPDGELKTWPEEREKVRDIALRYSQLKESVRRKKRFNLYEFLNTKKKKGKKNLNKRAKITNNGLKKKKNVNDLKYPISDHYSPDQVSQLIQSLELNVSTLQERLRFVETRKQEAKLDHPISVNHHQQAQTQSLNPIQFSLFMYNHGDATLSQIPLSASNFNLDFSKLLQESVLKNHLMKQETCGYGQNMCNSNITNNSQHPSVSNTEHYSAVQESVHNYGLNQVIMQEESYEWDQKLANINSNNFQHPCVSNYGSVHNYGLNQAMQEESNGWDQKLANIYSNNFQHPCLSNTQHY